MSETIVALPKALKGLAVLLAGLVAGLVVEHNLTPPPMEMFAEELDLTVPLNADDGMTLEPELLKKVSVLVVDPGAKEKVLPSPQSLLFDTRQPRACQTFKVVYSAADRQGGNNSPRITIRPHILDGSPCETTLEAKTLSGWVPIKIPADTAIELRLTSPTSDSLLEHQRIAEIKGRTRKRIGGPFGLTKTDVEVSKPVRVRGPALEVESLKLSNAVEIGELDVKIVAKQKVPSVDVDGTDVGRIFRIKIIASVIGWVRSHSP